MYCYFQSVTCLQTILLYLSDLFLFPHSFTYTNVLFSSFFQFRFFLLSRHFLDRDLSMHL